MRTWAAKFKMSVATVGMPTLLWLLSSLTIPGPLQAAVYFDSDFETCAVRTGNDFPCEGWTDYATEAVNYLEVTNSLVFSGAKSVKGTFDNVNGSSIKPSIYHFFPKGDQIFARFATRQSPGFQIGSNNYTKMVRFRTDGGYPVFTVLFGSGKYVMNVEGSYVGGTFVLTSGVTPSQTSWDQVEVEFKVNTPGQSNGWMRMWINGVLRAEKLNQQFRGPTSTSINSQGLLVPSTSRFESAQIYVQSGLGSIYYDRFAAGNTRIGLTTGQTSSDTTPPTIPTGVR